MINDLSKLPPTEKKVAAKVLYNMGWGSRKIEGWLHISDNSVLRAIKEPTPEELKRFEAEFIRSIQAAKAEGLALTINQIIKRIPKETKLEPLIKTAEYLEGKSGAANVQINNLVKIE